MTTRSKLVCLVLLVGGMVSAQTITPPIAEFRGLKAESSFRIDNTSDQSMSVMIQTKSFTVNDTGRVIYRPLEPTVRLSVGSSSFIIPPHDSHTIYYKAVSATSPASFSILPTLTPMSKATGVRINFCIPHMIYLYQKTKLAKSDVQVGLKSGKIIVANSSQKLGRVEYIQVGSEELGGFPIYPGQTREVAFSGGKATVYFEDGFKVDIY